MCLLYLYRVFYSPRASRNVNYKYMYNNAIYYCILRIYKPNQAKSVCYGAFKYLNTLQSCELK